MKNDTLRKGLKYEARPKCSFGPRNHQIPLIIVACGITFDALLWPAETFVRPASSFLLKMWPVYIFECETPPCLRTYKRPWKQRKRSCCISPDNYKIYQKNGIYNSYRQSNPAGDKS